MSSSLPETGHSRQFTAFVAALVVGLFALVGPVSEAGAQLTPPPDSDFSPAFCGEEVAGDAAGDTVGAMGHRDVVGEGGFPAVFVASDDSRLYVRFRIDADPYQVDGITLANQDWAIVFDTDADVEAWEVGVFLRLGDPVTASLRANDTVTLPDDPSDPSEREIKMLTPAMDVFAIDETASQIDGTPDYFVTVGVRWAELEAEGVDRSLDAFWVGGSRNQGALNGDLVCASTMPTLSASVLSASAEPTNNGTNNAATNGATGGDTNGATNGRNNADGPDAGCEGAQCPDGGDRYADAYVQGGGCSSVPAAGGVFPLLLVLAGLVRRRRR